MCRPQLLELSAAEELTAFEHLDVLQKNGFELVEVTEVTPSPDPISSLEGGTTIDVDAVVERQGGRRRFHLVAMPVSKKTTFNMKGTFSTHDPFVSELISFSRS